MSKMQRKRNRNGDLPGMRRNRFRNMRYVQWNREGNGRKVMPRALRRHRQSTPFMHEM